MKLNEKTLINIVETNDYILHHTNFINNIKSKDVRNFLTYEKKINLFKTTPTFRKLILSSNVLDDINNNYFCGSDIRYKVLKTLPNRKDSILINPNTLFRYIKTNDEIVCCFDYNTKEGSDKLFNFFFFIDLDKEQIVIDDTETLSGNKVSYDTFVEEFFSRFMSVVTYLELIPIDTIILEGNSKYGTKKNNKYVNETKKNFILVRSDWNIGKINLMDISVRGHFKLVPVGVGRSKYEYRWWNPYKLKVKVKRPQKELV